MCGDVGAWAFGAGDSEGSSSAGLRRNQEVVGQQWPLGVSVAEPRLLSMAACEERARCTGR
jgi:hypothetical protein